MATPSMMPGPAASAPQPGAEGGQTGVNQGSIQGEPGTGFEKAEGKGEFECGNCSFFSNNSCSQEDMKAKSQQPKNPDGSVQVDEDDCCEYVDRTGAKQEENELGHDTSGMNQPGKTPADHPLNQLKAKPKGFGL